MDSNWRSNRYFSEYEEVHTIRILEKTTSQLRLMKYLKDGSLVSGNECKTTDFLLKCLLAVTEEIRTRGTFDLLKEIIFKERSNCEQIFTLKEQIASSKQSFKHFEGLIHQESRKFRDECEFKDRIITDQSVELERLKKQNEIELAFNEELFRVQVEENELKCELEQKDLEKKIDSIKKEIEEEVKVHDEVLFYYDTEMKRLNGLIEYWEDRNKDIEERKLLLKSLLDSQLEQHEELQFYVSLFKSRDAEIREYLDDKERRRKEAEHELYLNEMATKIQSWWRGVMVRRCLGPFKHLLKIKNAKKRKMSLKKVIRK